MKTKELAKTKTGMTRSERYKHVTKAPVNIVSRPVSKKVIKKKPINKKRIVKKVPVRPISKKALLNQRVRQIKRRRARRRNRRILFFLFIIVITFFIIKSLINKDDPTKEVKSPKVNKEAELLAKYNNCLIKTYTDTEQNTEIDKYLKSLGSYFGANYSASVHYQDIVTGFSYDYNPSEVYYAASTIKMLDAIYIYDKATTKELDLDTKITYKSSHKMGASKKMADYQVGDKLSLRELVNFAITVSDNTAHAMLVDYIGKANLKAYGLSLGALNTLKGGDIFGQISTADAMIYLIKLNSLFADKNLGEELKNDFLTADQNYLSIANKKIVSAHKYGEYQTIYHDIGIVYDKSPYYIAILTNNGGDNNQELIENINAKVYDLHRMFIDNRETSCHESVYGTK